MHLWIILVKKNIGKGIRVFPRYHEECWAMTIDKVSDKRHSQSELVMALLLDGVIMAYSM